MITKEKLNSCEVDAVGIWDGSRPGIRLYWCGEIGFGTYDLIFAENFNEIDYETDEDGIADQQQKQKQYRLEITGMSECMDQGDNKEFIKHLLMTLVDKITVVE